MKKILIALLFLSTVLSLSAQKAEYRQHMVEGNLLLLEENYSRALHEYQKAYAIDSLNANVNFKIGFCYLKHPSEKHMAEHYLIKAVKDVSTKYNEEDPMMKSAPPLAYLYLGQAYHLDYKFDDALKMYDTYISFLNPKKFKDEIDLVEHYKQMSNIAHEKVATPFNVEITNMGDSINSEAPEFSPVISADERMMIFTYAGKKATGAEDGYRTPEDHFFEDIFVSFKKDDGTWTQAKSVSSNINTVGHDGAVALSPDGQTLIIYKDENGDGNLFFSNWDGSDWSYPKRFGPEINSPQWEPSACISADGNTLYFVSNRPGGFGGRDIYRCKKITEGIWSQPQNLGPKINTKYDEESPWLHPNGLDFFFSSQGHSSMGGFDVMFTTIDSAGNFTEVVSMPYPINTTDDDDFYVMSTDGKRAYYASAHEDRNGFGEQDIYMITLSHAIEDEDPVVLLKGKFQTTGRDSLPEGLSLVVTNKQTGEQVGVYRPQRNGNFTAILKPKNTYIFSYQLDGKEFFMEEISVSDDVTFQEIDREIPLKPVTITPDVLNPSPKLFLDVVVYNNQKEKQPVEGANVELTGKDGKVLELKTGSNGRVRQELEEGSNYKMIARSNGAYSEQVKFNSGKIKDKANTTVEKILFLSKGTQTDPVVTNTVTTNTVTTNNNTDEKTISLDVVVLSKKGMKAVPGAKITIKDGDGKVTEVIAGDDGKSKDNILEAGKVYTISASDGELSGREVTVSTKGIKTSKRIVKTIYTPAPTETYNVATIETGTFQHFFEYNKIEVEANPNYDKFLSDLEAAAKKGNVTVQITSSASQVPTRMDGGNKGLAKSRGENLKKLITDYLVSKGVDVSKVNITMKYGVNGPTYNSDYLLNKRKYEKFQFVKAVIKS